MSLKFVESPDLKCCPLEPESMAKESQRFSQTVLDSVKNFDVLPDSAKLRPAASALILGISMATYWRLVSAGKIAKPTPLFGKAVFNTVGEIRAMGRNAT
jgi:hypothetical protein